MKMEINVNWINYKCYAHIDNKEECIVYDNNNFMDKQLICILVVVSIH